MNNSIIRKTASRQKKLLFWNDSLLSQNLPKEDKANIESLLKQYKTLLNEILSAENTQIIEEKISITERKLNDLFESRRLLTSKIGVAAIDC